MAITYLNRLAPGTRFRVAGMPELQGELLDCSDCSAKVRLDGGPRDVEFEDDQGHTRRFRARRVTTTTFAPGTAVEVIAVSNPNLEDEPMATKKKTAKKTSTKKASKKAASNGAPRPKAAKPAKEAGPKKVGCIDAAAQILAASKQPLTCKELIEQMAAQELWTSPGGKTPDATLYSAIIREIARKGKESRFVKSDRGKFARA